MIMKLKKYIKIKPVHAIICAAIVTVSVIIDFVTKQLIVDNMELYDKIPIIPDVLQLKYITNYGAAFGSFSEHRWIFMSLSCLMIIAILVLIVTWDKPKPIFYIGTSMALGGGIGNMIDRIAYGYVIDFIDFHAFSFWKWVFNVADAFVCIGAALLVLFYITEVISSAKKDKKAENTSEGSNSDTETDNCSNYSTLTENDNGVIAEDTKEDTAKGEEA